MTAETSALVRKMYEGLDAIHGHRSSDHSRRCDQHLLGGYAEIVSNCVHHRPGVPYPGVAVTGVRVAAVDHNSLRHTVGHMSLRQHHRRGLYLIGSKYACSR